MGIYGYKKLVKPPDQIHELKMLIDKWREPALAKIDSRRCVPDTSNRGHTGLSVDHCHLLAMLMLKEGFRSREAQYKVKGQQGHDIPVVVRGSPTSEISTESLSYWRSRTSEEREFPPVQIGASEGWFTSLGNGHFLQALNLFHREMPNVFTQQKLIPDPKDLALTSALSQGVESIVLRAEMPVDERRRLAKILNWTHDYKWGVDANGTVDVRAEACENARYSLFEAQSKHMDSGDLTLQVRLELGLKIDDRSKIPHGRDGTPYPKNKDFQHLGLSRPLKRVKPRSKL